MKGKEKEEEKNIIEPLFPRLHVKDADKGGGPRAPPRNKMALYEQFSISTQRSNSVPPMPHLPPNNPSLLIPSNPVIQGCGRERNIIIPSYLPSYAPPHVSDIADTRSQGGVHHDMTREFEKNNSSYRNSTGKKPVAECSNIREGDSNARDSHIELNDADKFAVPTFDKSGNAIVSKIDSSFAEIKKLASFDNKNLQMDPTSALSSAIKLTDSNKKTLDKTRTLYLKSKSLKRNFTKQSVSGKSIELSVKDGVVEESSMEKVSGDKDETNNAQCTQLSLRAETLVRQESDRAKVLNDATNAETGNTSTVMHESCHKEASVKDNKTSKVFGNSNREDDGPDDNLSPDAGKKDKVSDASVDYISILDLSPDDVVKAMGSKHFWKTRRAIINQQRIFAIQVFELHRIIKVQKLIALSPHLLLEGNIFLLRSSTKAPSKILLLENQTNLQNQSVREKDSPNKSNHNTESATEGIIGSSLPSLAQIVKPCSANLLSIPTEPTPIVEPFSANPMSLPTVSAPNVNQFSVNHQPMQIVPAPSIEHFSVNPLPIPTVPENNLNNPCYFRPQTNQWFVPVMSPSEGLVYKAYTGPCPPSGSFMAPMYNGYTPLGVAPTGDFMNPAFGVSATHQPPNMGIISGAANYFPAPYALPPMNPMISSSLVEQVSNLAASRPTGSIDQQWPTVPVDQHWPTTGQMNQHNISNPRSDLFSGLQLGLPASKENELQESTTSSPSERAQQRGGGDVLPLFPTAPIANIPTVPIANNFSQPCLSTGSQTRVIKVVPLKAHSATESAARIFKTIQEERKQLG